jgi:hypothetical protein
MTLPELSLTANVKVYPKSVREEPFVVVFVDPG